MERSLSVILILLDSRRVDDRQLQEWVEAMLARVPLAQYVVADLVGRRMTGATTRVTSGGWDVADLRELVGRHDERLLGFLPSVLGGGVLRSTDPVELMALLRLIALLVTVPVLSARGRQAHRRAKRHGAEHPKLRQVRALLAKAESSTYDAEAEALMAKAQELIARHSLSRLLTDDQSERDDAAVVRRIWLDAPYVRAKTALVDEVGRANRCRTAVAEKYGFCVVVGAASDIDAVELLVTSLLVQAHQAMLRHGRLTNGRGASRTRSFRQSFLLAFATRIGERLRIVTDELTAEEHRWLPVVRSHEERVRQAFDDLVPHALGRPTSATDGEGWAAGVVAADLARLDVRAPVTRRSG